jgi:hypothetical protein
MTKAELYAQVDAMTEKEAAEVKLVYAPDWPDKVTLLRPGVAETEQGETLAFAELHSARSKSTERNLK